MIGREHKLDSRGRRRRLLLVDGHTLVRSASAEWINRACDLEVCGTTGSTAQAFHKIKRLHPDLVVCEIMKPRTLGFIKELHRQYPRLPILVFSIQDEVAYAIQAQAAGACGYLMKGADGEEFLRSIRAALRRRTPW